MKLKRRWQLIVPRLVLALPLLGMPWYASAQAITQISFAPASIPSGGTSQLTIVLGNANGNAATLTQTLTDTLPAGLTVANPAGVGGTCPAGDVGAAARSGSITYAADSPLPPGGCTITVNVTGTSAVRSTYYTDSIAAGALVTTLGSNKAAASGTLTVSAAVVVPNIVGLSQTAAATALQAAGLALGTVTKAPGPAAIPYNAVFAQVPAAGTSAAAGVAVAVSISTGAGRATNPNQPLTSVGGFVQPYQLSEAAAIERVCGALQSADPSSLSVSQRNLLANCLAILGTYGGGVNAAGLKNTLDALSGQQTTAQQRTGVQFSGAQFTNIGVRLAQLRQGVSGASFAGLEPGLPAGNGVAPLLSALAHDFGVAGNPAAGSLAPTGELGPSGGGAGDPSASIGASSRWGVFLNGSLRKGSQDPTTYETPFDFKANTVTAGVDYRISDRLVLGLALSHSSGSTDFTDGTGRLDSKNNSASLYGTFYNNEFYLDLIGTYGHISYDATRSTSFSINPNTVGAPSNCSGGDCSVNTTGSTGAQQLAFSANLGYSFHAGGFVWGPDAAVNYTHIKVNAFSENDPSQSGLALSYGDDTGESLLVKAGGHFSYAIKTSFAVVLPEARIHYVHEFQDQQRALSVHFSNDPDAGTPIGPVSNFVVFTDPPDRNYFDWAAGVSAQFPFGISAFADYNAIESPVQRVHDIAFGVRIELQMH
jgi:outer membrane lipase/esterase